jgi:hypothetical protein
MIRFMSRLWRKPSRRPVLTCLRAQRLEDRAVPAVIYALGAGEGGGPRVKVFNADGSTRFDFFAYEQSFRGGVHIATADVNGDGQADVITAPGNGGGPLIKVFDGNTGEQIRSFLAYDSAFRGGAWVAGGDMNGDGFAEVATGAGNGGGPHVKVFNGTDGTMTRDFFAFETGFRGGVRVATGRLHFGQPVSLVTAPGEGGGPLVRAFDGLTGGQLWQSLPFDGTGRRGAYITVADVTGDGIDEVLVGQGSPYTSKVRVLQAYDGLPSPDYPAGFDAFPDGANQFGVRLRAVDLDGDGLAEVLAVEGPGGSNQLRTFDGKDLTPSANASAFEADFLGGAYVG